MHKRTEPIHSSFVKNYVNFKNKKSRVSHKSIIMTARKPERCRRKKKKKKKEAHVRSGKPYYHTPPTRK